jgi:hypothetical protein
VADFISLPSTALCDKLSQVCFICKNQQGKKKKRNKQSKTYKGRYLVYQGYDGDRKDNCRNYQHKAEGGHFS